MSFFLIALDEFSTDERPSSSITKNSILGVYVDGGSLPSLDLLRDQGKTWCQEPCVKYHIAVERLRSAMVRLISSGWASVAAARLEAE